MLIRIQVPIILRDHYDYTASSSPSFLASLFNRRSSIKINLQRATISTDTDVAVYGQPVQCLSGVISDITTAMGALTQLQARPRPKSNMHSVRVIIHLTEVRLTLSCNWRL